MKMQEIATFLEGLLNVETDVYTHYQSDTEENAMEIIFDDALVGHLFKLEDDCYLYHSYEPAHTEHLLVQPSQKEIMQFVLTTICSYAEKHTLEEN